MDQGGKGHGRLLQGPIEGLGAPICKYEGHAGPELGGARVVWQPMGTCLLTPQRRGPAGAGSERLEPQTRRETGQ